MDNVDFFREIGKLKDVKRKGWIIDGVKVPESVADHSWRTAVMAMILGERRGLDVCKVTKMALIHDIAESKTGDLVIIRKRDLDKETPKNVFDDISEEEKRDREEKAFGELTSMLGEQGKGWFELWKEFEKGETKEAAFVRQIDKLEMAFQALEYEVKGSHKRKNLEHYFKDTRNKLKDQELIKILDELCSRRPKNNI